MRLWQGGLRKVHQVLAGLRQEASACLAAYDVYSVVSVRCSVRPAAAGLPSSGPLPNNFAQEDSEPQYEEDELQNDARQAAFENGDEVEESALHPRLEAISVHMGRKLRRDCPGNPSKLGMEDFTRMANRETQRPGQEWPLFVHVAPRSGMVVARVQADPSHPVPKPIPFGALERWTRENVPFALLERRFPWSSVLAFQAPASV